MTQPSQMRDYKEVPWFRRSRWVTVMVAGIVFLGPIFAIPVLIILASGPVIRNSGSGYKRWDLSTRGLVLVFSLFSAVVWTGKVYVLCTQSAKIEPVDNTPAMLQDSLESKAMRLKRAQDVNQTGSVQEPATNPSGK